MTEPRFRISVSQTAKGLHQFDGTVELDACTVKTSISPEDVGDVTEKSIGEKLLEIIKSAEDAFRKDNRQLVVDQK